MDFFILFSGNHQANTPFSQLKSQFNFSCRYRHFFLVFHHNQSIHA